MARLEAANQEASARYEALEADFTAKLLEASGGLKDVQVAQVEAAKELEEARQEFSGRLVAVESKVGGGGGAGLDCLA